MSKKIDITSFDAVSESDQPVKVEMMNDNGTSTGIELHVLGRYSTKVEEWERKFHADYQKELEKARRSNRNKDPYLVKSYDELKQEDVEGTLIKVVGWTNVQQEFNTDLLAKALTRNPHWRRQINEASDDYTNFTKVA